MNDEEFEPQLNIFGVLSNLYQRHEIIVDRTYAIDEPSGPVIDDALVILSEDTFTDTLEFSYSNERYFTEPIILDPLTTYDLIVGKEGFDTVYAATTIPGDFTIFFPLYTDTITLQDTILFEQSAGAALYSLTFIPYVGGFGPSFLYEPDPLDSLVQIPVGEYVDEHCVGRFQIYISAYDSNYYEYYFVEADSVAQAGVTGGVGLFGSTWSEATSAYVIFNPGSDLEIRN
jgi:hypothetical protein